jgi:aspartate/methionine/tyrosine aminotransferase
MHHHHHHHHHEHCRRRHSSNRYGGPEHTVIEGPNVVNIFSFSKAFAMMGWRIGYIVSNKK